MKNIRVVTDDQPPADQSSVPAQLGPDGLALWNAVMEQFGVTDVGGRALLEQCCRATDRAESCRAAIASDGEMVQTRTGFKEHPLLKAELSNRAFVARTIQKLGIALEPVRPPGRPLGGGGRR